MSTYEIKNSVHYYEINTQRQASPMAVLNYFEETAVRQSEACGYGIGRLIDQCLIWILTNWSINSSGIFPSINGGSLQERSCLWRGCAF